MPVGNWSDEEIQSRLDRDNTAIHDAYEAANFLGVDITASDDEIQQAYRELSLKLHPDIGGNETAFSALGNARDLLIQVEGAEAAQRQRAEARRQGAPSSPGTGGFTDSQAERQEAYRDTYEAVKVTFVEEALGINLEQYRTVEGAMSDDIISQADLDTVEETLRQAYGVPELDLDDIARVIASLVVSGTVKMGSARYAAERSGVFGGRGTGSFGSNMGRFGGGGTGPFSR